jgi:tape measure domain-containing protein
VADSLGSAVLTLAVDTRQLDAGLNAAERQAQAQAKSISSAFSRTGKDLAGLNLGAKGKQIEFTSAFSADGLRAGLEQANRLTRGDRRIEFTGVFTTTGLREGIENAKQVGRREGSLELPTALDLSGVKSGAKQAGQETRRQKPLIFASGLDASGVKTGVRNAQRQSSQRPIQFLSGLDLSGLQAGLQQSTRLTTGQRRVEYSSTFNAAGVLNGVQQTERKTEKRKPVEFTGTFNPSGLQAGLKRAETAAAQSAKRIEQSLTIGKSITSLSIKLNSLRNELENVAIGSAQFRSLRSQIASTQKEFDDATGAVAELAATGTLAFGPLAIAALGVGAAVVGIGTAATQTAGRIQKLNAAFIGLTGSAEAAKQLRQDLFTLSKSTPFKNDEILTAAQRFLAVGVNVKQLQGTINRVGAIAAQSGQPLERLALIYAQVYAKGRLQGEENLQLLEAGVDLTQELAQVTGKSGTALQDAMSKGQISVNDFNKALVLATGDMTALQLAGQAVDVQFNNIFDNFGQLFGGLASSVAPALSAAFGIVNQILDQAFPSLASIEELFAPLTAEAKRFSDVLAGNPELISAIAAATREWAQLLVNNVASGLKFVSDILSEIDGKQLLEVFLAVELALRRTALAASALGVTLAKNAELTFRAISNPAKFAQDIIKAGGFSEFIQQEYKDAEKRWNDWANSKPLDPPTVKTKNKEQPAGDLTSKTPGPDPELLAKQRQQNVESELALRNVQQRIAYAKQLAAAEAGVVRQTIQQRQEIEAGIQAAKDQVTQIGAQIDSLRLQGKDSGPELEKLVAEQKVAAQEIRLKLIEGATALKDASKKLAEDAQRARDELAGVRTDPEGLNKYLNPVQRQERAQQSLDSVLPDFRAAQARFSQLTGAQAPDFSGTVEGVLGSVRDFIARVNRESSAVNDVQNIQKALSESNISLVKTNEELAKVTKQLADKKWEVNVNVPGGTSSGDVLGPINAGF